MNSHIGVCAGYSIVILLFLSLNQPIHAKQNRKHGHRHTTATPTPTPTVTASPTAAAILTATPAPPATPALISTPTPTTKSDQVTSPAARKLEQTSKPSPTATPSTSPAAGKSFEDLSRENNRWIQEAFPSAPGSTAKSASHSAAWQNGYEAGKIHRERGEPRQSLMQLNTLREVRGDDFYDGYIEGLHGNGNP